MTSFQNHSTEKKVCQLPPSNYQSPKVTEYYTDILDVTTGKIKTIKMILEKFFGVKFLKEIHRRGFKSNCEKVEVTRILLLELREHYPNEWRRDGWSLNGHGLIFVEVPGKHRARILEKVQY